ncbi:S-4TM family putative pore-forming effector [Dethiobacter alkaliphilus]|uniref:S-4TM family putative pore-forming effector n=1 Tax=Dethiobacter alkaliphilus TaxID=427926 RepID=UPI002227761D|nr:S-4TM family putative pore-forming effector [Dethiobacter alkaliphilus]MCW3491337.1 S-4TM family putative pore-forming effector [Dethiobacter alkaliphilus]
MSVNVIEKKQNEERMLRYQFAARKYYNCAETLNDIVWVCCLISWFTIFLPDSITWGTLIVAVPFFVNIIAAFVNWQMTIKVSLASALRKYFDAYVLGINIDQFTGPEVQHLEELSIKAVSHCPDKSKEQMTNTGRDNPPGVRNWYEFSQPLSKLDAIYECQKQNCWWNKKLSRERIIRTVIALSVLVPLAIFLLAKTRVGILPVVFGSSGLIIKCVERLVANVRYYMLSLKIDGALDVLTNSRSDENIKNLQAKIDIRRAMPVFERNRIHKRHAKEYSKLYHDTTAVHK